MCLESAVLIENIGYQLDNLSVIVNNKNFPLAGLYGIEGNLIFLHKFDETLARNSSES